MVDREKVIKKAERIMCSTVSRDMIDSFCEDVIALLKEQEPVAPVMVPHSRGIAYNCGACGTEIAVIRDTISADSLKNNVRYCRMCGRAVKWE